MKKTPSNGRRKPRGRLVPITPSVLRWALAESGLKRAEVAHRLSISRDTLRRWESGGAQPNLTTARKLATLLRRQAAVFLLPQPPQLDRPEIKFRLVSGANGRSELNTTERRYIREAWRLQQALRWVAEQTGSHRVNLPSLTVAADPEVAGAEVRETLGVGATDHENWTTSSQALQSWRDALEVYGVLVFAFPLGEKSCKGFSVWDELVPIITVSTWWNNEARIFTLFHEYGHLLTRTSSACALTGGTARRGDDVERWCERFAAAVLLPWEQVASFLSKSCDWNQGQRVRDLEVVKKVARRFKVSLRTAALRLIEHQTASWSLYETIRPTADLKTGGGGGIGRERLRVRRDQLGARTLRLFTNAIQQDVLSATDVLGFLDITVRDLESLEQGQVA